MAFEAVDACFGTPHIASDDLAALNSAMVGKSDCVFDWADSLKLTMSNANTALIGKGVGMVGGRRFWNDAAVPVAVRSGTQGQKRNDIVVARYAKNDNGVESITPVVVSGTNSTGTPEDPAVTANDLKLWRIPIDGITVGTPVRLFDPVVPVATLGESVSPIEDTGWVSLYHSETQGNVAYRARNGVCTLQVSGICGLAAGSTWKVPATIPSRYLPMFGFYGPAVHRQQNNVAQVWVPGQNSFGSDPGLYVYAIVSASSSFIAINSTITWVYGA